MSKLLINLTEQAMQALHNHVALDGATLIGSQCDNCGSDGTILLIPMDEIMSMRCGEDVDELNDLEGKNIIEVLVNTTEGEQTYYIYDFIVINPFN